MILTLDRATRPLSGARIRFRTLPAEWEPTTVTNPAITTQIHKALYVHGNFSPKLPFNLISAVNDFSDGANLLFS